MAAHRHRLDTLVVERGIAGSRERARALILAGQVAVDGRIVSKAGTAIADDARVELIAPDHPYVGRGGIKLAHALEAFGVDPAGRRALDIGASTGGFTDVLLRRGALSVISLDVGHGQLDWRLRNDPRVIVMERVNARSLRVEDLPHRVSLVTIDVSFISLRHILPTLVDVLERRTGGLGRTQGKAPADVIALVKPQFEAGRAEVGPGGLVRDPEVHRAVLERVSDAADAAGLATSGMTPSPIAGAKGNQEFFLHLRPGRREAVSPQLGAPPRGGPQR